MARRRRCVPSLLTASDPDLTLGDMSMVRGTSLQGFVELVDELGGDPGTLLALSRVPPTAVGDHESFIDYRHAVAALEAAASATGAGDFGRQLATRQGLEILGPLGVAARTAATVGAALEAIEKYFGVYSPAMAVSVRAVPGEPLADLEWQVIAHRPPPYRQAAELALGVTLRVLQLLAGADFRPTSVSLAHRALTPPATYADYFGCPVRFSQPSYALRFQQPILGRRLGEDSDVHAIARQYLSTIVVPTASNTSDSVERLIRRMLPTGGADLDVVAGHLAQHRRTLQRQLAAQGTSFAELVDQVRREDAEGYLRDTDMPLSQLAGVLGFSEQSALSRACRRWFDASPREVRRASRDQPAAARSSVGPVPGPAS